MRTTLRDDFRTYILHSGNTLNKLIAVNIGVFIVLGLIWMVDHLFLINGHIERDAEQYLLSFPASPKAFLYRPWSMISYQFTHLELWHLISNMIVLFLGGRIFREFLGDRKLLIVYILGGIAGALMFMVAMNLFPVFIGTDPFIIGASASAFAILVAAATLVPNYTIFLVLIGPVKLVYIMLVLFVLDILSLAGGNGGGHFSHVGGAIFGYFYIKGLQSGNDIGAWLSGFLDWVKNLFQPTQKNLKVNYSSSTKPKPEKRNVSQEQIDAILDKIAKSGYDSLSQGEKEILFKASKDN